MAALKQRIFVCHLERASPKFNRKFTAFTAVMRYSSSNSAETALSVTDKGCEPNQLTVASGQNNFVLTNKSSQPLEWEILSGVIINKNH